MSRTSMNVGIVDGVKFVLIAVTQVCNVLL